MKRRIFFAISGLSATFLVLVGIVAVSLYLTAIQQLRESLQGIARSSAHLIGDHLTADRLLGSLSSPGELGAGLPHGLLAELLSDWGFGESGEIVVGRLAGGVILVTHSRHRPKDGGDPWERVSDPMLAEPMARALAGQPGSMIGRDYQGRRVLAAYQPLASLGLGVVVKQDLVEVRRPYLLTASLGGAGCLLVVAVAAGLAWRSAWTVAYEFEEHSRKLKAEVEDRWRAEESLTSLLDSLPMGVAVSERSGTIVRVNRGFEELLGGTKHELVGLSVEALIPAMQRDAHEQWRMDYLAGNSVPMVVGRKEPAYARRLDGSEIAVEVGLAPMTAGGERFVAATLLDVSDRQRTQDALLLTQLTVDNAADAIFWVRRDGGIHYANLAGLRMVGQEPEWLRELSFWDINPETTPDAWDEWWDRIRRAGTLTLDIQLRTRSGVSIPVELRVQHLERGRGELAVAFARDMTAHKESERQLINARQTAEEASRAKSSFLANMSHEIRTPLNAVLGFTQIMLRDPTLGHKHRETIKRIAISGKHLLALIEGILVVSKIDSGRLEITPEVFELATMLDELEALFVTPATERGLGLELIADPDLPGWVEADRVKIWRIAVNLVDNAIKFTREGGVTVRISAARTPSSSQVGLSLEVEDTGPGIPPAEQELVFERFEQSSRNHSGSGGAGLGLTICKDLAELLGGMLEFESEDGEGCLFRCTLPVIPVQASAEQIAAAARGRVRGRSRRIVGIEKNGQNRVLIVDDVETNRVLLSEVLCDFGFETRQISDPEAVVAANRRWAPDLILMDLLMPGIGGVEAIRRVRTILDGKQPRILAVTAAAVDSTISEALEAGADAVLSKPVDEQELLAEIARLLELELVFEELPVQDESSPALTPGGAARLVAELPADLQEALHSAAVAADLEQIEALMWKVEGRSSELGAWLKSAAFRYDYPSIIDAIDAIDAINDGREAPC